MRIRAAVAALVCVVACWTSFEFPVSYFDRLNGEEKITKRADVPLPDSRIRETSPEDENPFPCFYIPYDLRRVVFGHNFEFNLGYVRVVRIGDGMTSLHFKTIAGIVGSEGKAVPFVKAWRYRNCDPVQILVDVRCRFFSGIFEGYLNTDHVGSAEGFISKHCPHRSDPGALGALEVSFGAYNRHDGNGDENPGGYCYGLIGRGRKIFKYLAGVAAIIADSLVAIFGAGWLWRRMGNGGIPPSVFLWLGCLWILYHLVILLF